MKTMFAVAVAAVAISAATRSNALTFYFSFTNTVGNVDGTVKGEIGGLTDNSTGPASAIIIDSYPAGLAGPSGLGSYPTPFDVLSAWSGGTVVENSFTVSGGYIMQALFSITGANGDNDQLFLNSACACFYGTGHTNYLDIGSNDQLNVWNVGRLYAADGLVIEGGIPEPAAWALMTLGFGLAGSALRRRSRAQAAV